MDHFFSPNTPYLAPLGQDALEEAWKKNTWKEPFVPERRKILERDGCYYICYNTASVPEPPKFADDYTHRKVGPFSLKRPGYLYSDLPYLGYAPTFFRFDGFLRGLHYPRKVAPIVQSPDRLYRLRPSIIAKWFDLEESLTELRRALAHMTPILSANPWTLDFRYYNSPSYYGYQAGHLTKEQATTAANRSREAFRALIAIIRMYILINRKDWHTKLVRKYGALQAWVDAVKTTQLGRLSEDLDFKDCVGAFVHWENYRSVSVMKLHIRLGMPVWIIWGEKLDPYMHYRYDNSVEYQIQLRKYWEEFHPRPDEVESFKQPTTISLALDFNFENVCGSWDSELPKNNPAPFEEITVPRPYPDSGQLRGETPLQFLARRKRMLDKRVENETQQECQARLNRLEYAKQKSVPGKKGAACFRWLEGTSGYLLRTRVPRDIVEDVWLDYSAAAKIYDPLKDEWDLWEGFDKGNGPAECDIEAYNSGLDRYGNPLSGEELKELKYEIEHPSENSDRQLVPPGALFPDLTDDSVSISSFSNSSHHSLTPEPIDPLHVFELNSVRMHQQALAFREDYGAEPDMQWSMDEDIVEDARLRLGYSPCRKTYLHLAPVNISQFAPCIGKLYASKSTPLHSISPRVRQDLFDLISAIEDCDGDPNKLPRDLCDLRRGNARYLGIASNARVHVEIRDMLVQAGGGGGRQTTKRARQTKPIYFVKPAVNHSHWKRPWTLALENPINVLECLRFQGDFGSLIRHLVSRGIPIHTVQLDSQSQYQTSRDSESELSCPVRLPDEDIPTVDFRQSFLKAADLLLNNHRVARAALMRGGVIWRITIEIVMKSLVLDGPSQEALDAVMDCVSLDGKTVETWYDDSLTLEEEYTILGVFRSSNEKSHKSEKLWSFWPIMFSKCSVDAHYWTKYNEDWFLKRKQALLDPSSLLLAEQRNFKPLHFQAEWRDKLQGQKKVGLKFIMALKAVAKRFLWDVFSTSVW
ncbi:uncharacterized protein FOMMEDRAFT_22875 [Fomitiporia mediterranea MF3/22]|uniref:uncharacterized protein n=1 Tax=Fomitiporia mediterranea (strain MF3/22) TaxID=694068 RepID=UPI0004408298|nr:uncharacterized protein FOMMEDRAFT_22875 [Fomitiporia mediterranea MF3/22]EJC99815.1 hypothetical protein FOMMEDRAFT_22875 [Fomitiporia mediterranea MF3/22]